MDHGKKEGTFLFRTISLMILLTVIFSFPGVIVNAEYLSSRVNPAAVPKININELSTEEKIGQLFLITFQGNQYGKDSRIYSLITDRHIGGVLLERDNDNFPGPDTVLPSTYELTSALQSIAWDANQTAENQKTFLPLFIAVAQNGDKAPLDQIISGMSPLPNQLAIGAAWDPNLAHETGKILGSELSSLGFNMFIGPSLDVLDDVQTIGGEDIGAQVFGGDPYWVGVMGQQYISGLHEGGGSSMAVISKNFPGRGGADRPAEEEVSTVRKSLEQLKQIELAPFFAVTGLASDPAATTDGLLVSHIRYQGFQGNIRATTKPVSFDKAALDSILSLEPLVNWRKSGGIIVSDRLGSQSLRRFFDPSNSGFDARQVARNAFLAGNDILLLDQNFISTGDTDAYQTINRTLDFFIQKYNEDPAFAQRVDESVSRIVALKEKMYPSAKIEDVIPPEENLAKIGTSQGVSFETARESVTLISPEEGELKNLMPSPPEMSDRIVFFTDMLTAKQCSNCPDETQMGVDSLQSAVLRLYGPHASGQVMQSHLVSYSFNRLMTYLKDPTGDSELGDSLKSADWVIFSILNEQNERPNSGALISVLNTHQELIRNKKVVVFAFNAPYYLDATDISKLTAYYGLYSKVAPFIDVAARILFQEIPPQGASPVSIPGIGYEIIVATSPDPNQVIPLGVDSAAAQLATTPEETETVQAPEFKIGDTLPISTGVIVDHNGNQVPDGTVARFIISSGADTSTSQQIETTTKQGLAKTSYQITQPGKIEIRVVSEPALVSQVLQLEVKEGEASQVTAIAPTPIFTETPPPNPTEVGEEQANAGQVTNPSQSGKFMGWLVSILVIGLGSLAAYQIGKRKYSSRWGIRWASCTAIGGLLFYTLAMLGWKDVLLSSGSKEVLILAGISLAGVLVGWGAGFIWLMFPRWMRKLE